MNSHPVNPVPVDSGSCPVAACPSDLRREALESPASRLPPLRGGTDVFALGVFDHRRVLDRHRVLDQRRVRGRARAAFRLDAAPSPERLVTERLVTELPALDPVAPGASASRRAGPRPAPAPGPGRAEAPPVIVAAPRSLLLDRYRDRTLQRRYDDGRRSRSPLSATPISPLRIDTASRFGNLGPYLLLDDVTDVVVTGSNGAWVDRGRGFERIAEWIPRPEAVRSLAVRLIAEGGRHVDEVTPFVDVRLPGGIRVHAVLPPLSVGGAALSIRVPAERPMLLDDLEARGMFWSSGGAISRRLRAAVGARTNVLISGGAGTGKTTLLAALLSHADPTERIICVEDVSELLLDHPHVVSLEARQPNAEGTGGVDIARLLRESLRMRPDRLVLGECRGGEIRDMLGALNTGHEGGACTIHANSLDDVPARLEALGALAGMTAEAVARQSVSAIGLIVHLRRIDGMRRVTSLGSFIRDGRGRLVAAAEAVS